MLRLHLRHTHTRPYPRVGGTPAYLEGRLFPLAASAQPPSSREGCTDSTGASQVLREVRHEGERAQELPS